MLHRYWYCLCACSGAHIWYSNCSASDDVMVCGSSASDDVMVCGSSASDDVMVCQ